MKDVLDLKKLRIKNVRFLVFVIIFSCKAFAEMPLVTLEKTRQYELNSETVYFSDSRLIQSDLRLLIGKKIDLFAHHDLRLAVGGYGLLQDSETFDYSYRQGALAQVKINLWKNWLFFVYEYHHFTTRNQSDYQDENRYGVYGGYYYQVNERTVLDLYAESFHIPNISRNHPLSTGRASIFWDTQICEFHICDLVLELYAKDSPVNWGGSRTDLRTGFKLQPWDFVSAKIFAPLISSEDDTAGDWQGQINIFKVGDF